jgi:hypothetical protein
MFRIIAAALFFVAAAAIGLAPIASASGPYNNCSQAKADGVCNITQDSPWYSRNSTATATASRASADRTVQSRWLPSKRDRTGS